MKIMELAVGGFRNIQHVHLSLDKLTALVSANNYGKSNVLDAIDFTFQFIKSEADNREKMMKNPDIMPLNKQNDTANFSASITFTYDDDTQKKSFFITYSLEFVWAKQHEHGCQIISEDLQMKENKKNQRYSAIIKRRGRQCWYKPIEKGRCDREIPVQSSQLAIQEVKSQGDKLFYQDILQALATFQVYRDRHFDVTPEYLPNPFIYRNQNEFDIRSISNIPRVIFHLKQQYPSEYTLLENTFLQLFPYITEISVQEFRLDKQHGIPVSEAIPFVVSEKIYSMYVLDEHINQPLPFTRLSDGAKRIFLMLTYVVLANIQGNTLILLEEPENSIHPRLLQALLIALEQLAGDGSILFASHSPYILEYMQTEDIYIGKPNDTGLAAFSRIDAKKVHALYKDAETYSSSVGQYLFELLSGDAVDTDCLTEYLES